MRHGIAVAIHLLDFVGASMPRELRKAIVASGLVHDLGKALVPQVLFKAPHFEASHRKAISEHVPLLLDRLQGCQWLSAGVAQAVIGGINERMDGSGYPGGLSGADLSELAKASAVVDVVEAMRRDRTDRSAKTAQQIYRHLLQHPTTLIRAGSSATSIILRGCQWARWRASPVSSRVGYYALMLRATPLRYCLRHRLSRPCVTMWGWLYGIILLSDWVEQ